MCFGEIQALKRPVSIALILATSLLALACDRGGESDAAGGRADAPQAATNATPGDDTNELAELLRIPDALERLERVSRFLQAAPPDQLEEIKHTFASAALDRGDLEYVLFIEWWAQFDPRLAFRFAVGPEIRNENGRLAAAAARAWARQDPQAAIESNYLRRPQSNDKSYSSELLDGLVVGWFESGKPGLEEFIANLTTRSDVARGTRTYARMRVLRDGARETLEWTREPGPFPPDHSRLLLAGALTVISHQDPQLAIEWLPIAEADEIDTRTFKMRIAGGWAHHDPRAAFEWIATLPDDAERTSAFARAATRWHELNPSEFRAWLAQQAGDGTYDPNRAYTVRTDILRNPLYVDWPGALDLAQQTVDDGQRLRLVSWALQQWMFLDPQAAEAWIAANREELHADAIERAKEISEFDQRRLERRIEEQRRYAS